MDRTIIAMGVVSEYVVVWILILLIMSFVQQKIKQKFFSQVNDWAIGPLIVLFLSTMSTLSIFVYNYMYLFV